LKIQHIADVHREYMDNKAGILRAENRVVLDAIRDSSADVLVIAGDLNHKRRSIPLAADLANGRQCVVVAGNHEYYSDTIGACIAHMRKQAAEYPNLHFLEREAIEIEDVIFLGCTLWTNMRMFAESVGYEKTLSDCQTGMADYLYIKATGGNRALRPADTVKIWQKSFRWLHEQMHEHAGKRIVVVTHHAPSLRSIPENYREDVVSAAYASHLDRFVEIHQPAAWIHGHTHNVVDYQIGKTRVLSNCRGYDNEIAEAMGFNPAAEIEL